MFGDNQSVVTSSTFFALLYAIEALECSILPPHPRSDLLMHKDKSQGAEQRGVTSQSARAPQGGQAAAFIIAPWLLSPEECAHV
jgi:hypothetical protein